MDDIRTHPAPLPQRDNSKLAIWIFLGGEVIFFGALISAYLLFHIHEPAAFADAKLHLSIPLVGTNTFILILSSFMVVQALEAIHEGRTRAMRNYLLLVTLLGLMFLGGQAIEWTTLFREGISFNSTFGTPFFTITGIHGTHVFIGILWSLFLQFEIARKAFSAKNYRPVEVFGLYWHFVDVVWIVLFTIFYLII